MSEQLTLSAEARDRAGKGASRALRNQGRVPAVVYGEKQEPLSIHIEEKTLVKVLSTGHFMNSVVMIDVGGSQTRTLPKDVQFHPVTDRPRACRLPPHRRACDGHRRGADPLRQRREFARPQARRRAQRRAPRARAGLRRGRDPGRSDDRPRRHRHRRFDPYQPGHPAQGHQVGDHRSRLHHRHHRRARPASSRRRPRPRRPPKAPRSWLRTKCRWSARKPAEGEGEGA